MNHLFIFGLGFSASAIGAALRRDGWQVSGTVRSSAKFDALKAQGFAPLLFGDAGGVRRALDGATHCLVSVPPREPGPVSSPLGVAASGSGRETGDPVLAAHGPALRAASSLRWAGYLSTIGVYGDLQGAWADEETAAEPETERGVARLEAEAAWTAFCRERGLPLDIFRLAGIYGPGRNPLDRVRRGEAHRIVKPGQVFNRIHVDDIARTVAAAIFQERLEPGTRLFNLADDEPAPPQDVILYAAELIGVPPPPELQFEEAALSPMARSFYAGNKRLRNAKIKRELGVALKYPTYREGLRALLDGEAFR
jgi:nucleoside-diphosphate-sugar epimerase